MKISFELIEKVTGKKVRKNYKCIGCDIASRTGLCTIRTSKTELDLSWQFLEFDKSSSKAKYKTMVQGFEDVITPELKKAIIEDTHLKYFKNKFTGRLQPQVTVLKQLTRYGAFCVSKCIRENVVYEFIGVTKSRANFKIKTKRGQAKKSIAEWLKTNLEIDLGGDEDCSDAVILALNGVLK